MISVPDLRDAEPSIFTRDAQRWKDLASQVADRDKHLASLADWQGAASDAAKANLGEQRKKLADAAEQLGKIPPVLTAVGDRLDRAQQKLREATNTARDNGLDIQSDGTVKPAEFVPAPPGRDPSPPPMPGQPAPSSPPSAQQVAAQLTTTVQDLLREATSADEEAAAALRRLTAQATGFAVAPGDPTVTSASAAIPARGTAPAEVKKWWDSLNPQQQESLLFAHPDQIGALDGIPAVFRDRANRDVLGEQRSRLDEERIRLESKPNRSDDENRRLDDLKGKIGGLDAVADRLKTAPSSDHPQPYLLGISTDGNGRAIVAMGNPDTAANVATYVPGTKASLASCRGDLQRSDTTSRAAEKAGSPSTSVIAWIGYDAPQSIVPEAAEDKYADGAEKDLSRFQDGLRITHEGQPSHNTVVGHSYGTTVVGHTARDMTLNADDVVFVASPGVGVSDVRDLHLTGETPDQVAQHVHATVAQYDPINVSAGIHGPSPTNPSFGGTTFDSNPGEPGPWYKLGWNPGVHSQYWDDGNKALKNMGDVIAGKPTS
ncbi:alpha/beta hydrolase [Solihabitans fulvus]|uniref:Alpha/beta hydrolase n=1 Tax=Solihabitans fulvus TaxID=1892852 RepID=A0A5B2XV09_9PSEU|nr:alpha/beta hydrolase [Solihabitans fulvus]KAA2266995.1 alpha/beta hydrolase [Solihabitans fulvus]